MSAWTSVFRRKLGLVKSRDGDEQLARSFLDVLADENVDFTIAFRTLSLAETSEESRRDLRQLFASPAQFDAWFKRWRERTSVEDGSATDRRRTMTQANPMFIPRNHRIEQAIAAAVHGDYKMLESLSRVLSNPFTDQPEFSEYALAPARDEIVTKTFCGT